jgi:hypothetical protein
VTVAFSRVGIFGIRERYDFELTIADRVSA